MFSNIQTLELYYDSTYSDPKEDPVELRERLSDLEQGASFDYTATDTADLGSDERHELATETIDQIRSDREYDVGNKVFAGGMFGRIRPALVIRYENAEGIDLYPHRNDAGSDLPIRVQDFLDELDDDATSDRGDYERIRTDTSDEETATDSPQQGEGDSTVDSLLDRIVSSVPG